MTSHSNITTLRARKHCVKVASSTANVGGRMRSDTAPSGLLGLGHLQSSRDAVFRSTYRPASRRSSAQFWRKSSLELDGFIEKLVGEDVRRLEVGLGRLTGGGEDGAEVRNQ